MDDDEWYESRRKRELSSHHYMSAEKPQADTTYVDIRTHTSQQIK